MSTTDHSTVASDQALKNLAKTIARPFEEFFKLEAISGILLLIAALAALILANSPLGDAYHHFWELSVGITFGDFSFQKTLHHWINDGLMVIFFFLVGLEIKREVLVGELSSIRQATLPIAAAIGGMVVPALFYYLLNNDGPASAGWGIPMATDIAFALGCLALLGKRVPAAILVFLTALAIVDDLGGIFVIAAFYTEQISVGALLIASVLLAVSALLNYFGIRKAFPYVITGIFLWLALLQSGIHSTVAGILLAMTIPASTAITGRDFVATVEKQLHYLTSKNDDAGVCPLIEVDEAAKQSVIHSLETACADAEAPLEHIEHTLHPWVVYLIMPIFAFANAGVHINFGQLGTTLADPIFLGIILGLVAGKQVGIFSFCWLAVKAGWASLPIGVTWGHIYGVSLLAGIGFTMSLFIGVLAFSDPAMLETAKLAILVASLASGIIGYQVLKRVTQPQTTSPVA